MKITIFTLIAILLCYSAVTYAQPTITFSPSSGNTLTKEDVDSILAANGLDRESEFYATIGSDVTTIDNRTFRECRYLLSVEGPNVTNIGDSAFMYCFSLATADFPNVSVIGN